MMKLIRGEDVSVRPRIMEKVWRFRHDQFVEGLRWEALRKADGREIDEFDDDSAIHLPIVDGAYVVGYSRLLPTTGPHLLSHVYPEILQGAERPCGEDILEWTRCIASDHIVGEIGAKATNLLGIGVAEYCVANGVRALLIETHPKLAHHMTEFGWDVRPLHVPVIFEGRPFVAVLAYPTRQIIQAMRRAFDVKGQVLDPIGDDLPDTPSLPYRFPQQTKGN